MATYAVSDIHGYYDLFLKGLSEIYFSEGDFLWCLGDMIDRGPDGIKILQHIMSHDNMDLLIGNHELMFLNSVEESGEAICNGNDAHLWLNANGGRITFNQYKALQEKDRINLLDWMRQRYVVRRIDIDDRAYCLTHSFYNPKCENKRYCELTYSDVWNITWSSIWRDDPLTKAMDIYPDYDYTFICGHVPVQRIRAGQMPDENMNALRSYKHENVVNIDGGCAKGYAINANNGAIFLRLNDMQEFAVELKNVSLAP